MYSQTKDFLVKSLSKCGKTGDLDCSVVYVSDAEFSFFAMPDGQVLGPPNFRADSCNVQIQFQQRGTVESLSEESGVVRIATGVQYSFQAGDLYFNPSTLKDPYNCSWADLKVGQSIFFIPFRNRGVLKQRSQSAPVLQRALGITFYERILTARTELDDSVPQGTIAIPKWMWPSLCPLTAAESCAVSAPPQTVSSPVPSSSAAAAAAAPDTAPHDAAQQQLALDGLRDRTVRVTLVPSSQVSKFK
jgi:hypothetical protein